MLKSATNSQIIHITEIGRCDIVNDTYKLNLSDEQIDAVSANICIAVMGGVDFASLRLFRDTSRAEKYIVELLNKEIIYGYVQVQIQDLGQKIGKINNAIINAGLGYEDSYGDIVINCLLDAVNVDEFYKQEIEDVKYITNSDLNYSSAFLYINSELYIDTDKCCVYWYDNDNCAYKKAIPKTLKDKVDYLNELAQKAYNEKVAEYPIGDTFKDTTTGSMYKAVGKSE